MRGITEESLRHVMKMHDMNDSETSLIFSHLFNECKELNAWHPIETAPHDKCLLVSDAANDIYIGEFTSQYGRWYVDIGINVAPIYWQELPEDPK